MTQQDYDLYLYIADYIEKRGYSPLFAEMASALEMSEQVVRYQLQRLWNQGYICYPLHLSGMIYLTSKDPDFDSRSQETKANPIIAVKNGDHKTAIYHYVADYIQVCERSPSLDEIARALDIGKTTVKYYVDQLKAAGYLQYQPHKRRTLSLTKQRLAS